MFIVAGVCLLLRVCVCCCGCVFIVAGVCLGRGRSGLQMDFQVRKDMSVGTTIMS